MHGRESHAPIQQRCGHRGDWWPIGRRRKLAGSPDLAGQITTKNDPASQSITASQYLLDGAQSLRASGISNPTVLDVRSYYQFGPGYGAQVASASGNQLMSDVLNGMSPASLRANGIGDMTTVSQWRASVTSKIGDAASQPVLLGSPT